MDTQRNILCNSYYTDGKWGKATPRKENKESYTKARMENQTWK